MDDKGRDILPAMAIGDQLRKAADTVPFVQPLHDLALNDPLAALIAVQRLRAVLEDAESLAVVVARNRRTPWREIGEATQLPLRTAHRHYRHLDVAVPYATAI